MRFIALALFLVASVAVAQETAAPSPDTARPAEPGSAPASPAASAGTTAAPTAPTAAPQAGAGEDASAAASDATPQAGPAAAAAAEGGDVTPASPAGNAPAAPAGASSPTAPVTAPDTAEATPPPATTDDTQDGDATASQAAPAEARSTPASADADTPPAATAADAAAPGPAAPTQPAAAASQARSGAPATPAGNETNAVPAGDTAEPRTISIGLLEDAPPFSSAARYGVRTGFDVDLAYGICGRLERRCRFASLSRVELVQALRDRRLDAVIASDGRPENFDAIATFTRPYLSLAARFVVPRSTATDLETENATAYGAVIGTPHAQYLQATYKNPSDVALYASADEMWIDLALGRLQGALATAVTARLEFLDTPLGNQFRFATGSLAEAKVAANEAAVAVRKGDDAMLEELNNALADYMSSPDYSEAINRHLTGGLATRPVAASGKS